MWIEQVLSGFQAMSYWEYVAVALGVAYLLLAIKQSLWCWPAAFVSTFIYTILFWQGFLYMESVLNFYYLLMAIYGWQQWRDGRTNNNEPFKTQNKTKPIVSWSKQKHITYIGVGIVISLGLGFVLDNHTQARMAYLDTFTTVFSVITTYMVTQKVLEQWLYWVIIDAASVYLYVQQGYYPTAGLFILYTVLAVQGYLVWRKDSVQQVNNAYA